MYTLGFDASTQSFSAIVIDPAEGIIIAEHTINFGKHLPQYNSPQGFIQSGSGKEVHSDPCMWLDALELLLEDLAKLCDLSKVSGISGAGQQHGSVYLNSEWNKILPVLHTNASLSVQLRPCLSRSTSPIWMDGSTSRECGEISESVGSNQEVCNKSGSITIERFTGPQIRRFSKIDPLGYQKTERIHLVSSFICSILCGTDAPIDTGDGAGMNLLNLENWDWDPMLLDATAPELMQKLPAVKDGSTICGQIAPYFVEKFGFQEATPITIFTGDNPSSLVGMGASQPGKVVISLGTSDTVFAAMPATVSDPDGCGHVFGNPSGGSMSLQCFINGSLARESVKDKFHFDWDQFTSALTRTKPGNEGAVMLPFFRPEISPRINLKKPILSGSRDFELWSTPESNIRACVEGQFLNMKRSTQWMQLTPETIYLTGGASTNDAIAQILADIFQAKVQRLAVSGSVALGGALRAAVNSLKIPLEDLESKFCQPDAGSTLDPQDNVEAYQLTEERFAALITKASSK